MNPSTIKEPHEEDIESPRQSGYEDHVHLIPLALNLNFSELQNAIYKLVSLKSALEQEIPQLRGTSLFLNILLNNKLSSTEKYSLLETLLSSKGYHAYSDILFSTPTLDLLCQDLEPLKLLGPLYSLILFFFQKSTSSASETRIWPILAKTSPWQVFRIMIGSPHHQNKVLLFLAHWVHSLEITNLLSLKELYSEIVSRYGELLSDYIYQGIQNSFLRKTQYDRLAWFEISMKCKKPINYTLAFLENLAPNLRRQDLSAFLKAYKALFESNQELPPILSQEAYHKIFELDENQGQPIYLLLQSHGTGPDGLLHYLAFWLQYCSTPSNLLFAENAYFSLLSQTETPYEKEAEAFIWQTLINQEPEIAFNLFRQMFTNPNTKEKKTLTFISLWLNSLKTEAEINLATVNLAITIKGTALENYWYLIRLLSDQCRLQLALKSNDSATNPARLFSYSSREGNKIMTIEAHGEAKYER